MYEQNAFQIIIKVKEKAVDERNSLYKYVEELNEKIRCLTEEARSLLN